jgi:hypothetical protein
MIVSTTAYAKDFDYMLSLKKTKIPAPSYQDEVSQTFLGQMI